MEKNLQIEFYLKNENELLKNWYIKKTYKETGLEFGEPIGIKDYKKEFEIWLKLKKVELQKEICPFKEEILLIHSNIDVVLKIAELIRFIPEIPALYETSTLIFIFALETLCNND